MRLKDLPLDLLQEASAALDRYARARRQDKLRQERARLQEELQDMRTDLAEIQALAAHPAGALHPAATCSEGTSSGVDGTTEVENHA
jgi:hypothetical protein